MRGKNNEPGHLFEGFESIPLRVTVKVGGARSTVGNLGGLKEGDVIELDRRIGEPFELLAHGYLLGLVEPVAVGSAVAVKLVCVPEDDDVPGS